MQKLGNLSVANKQTPLIKTFVHTCIYAQPLSEGHIHWVESLQNLPFLLPTGHFTNAGKKHPSFPIWMYLNICGKMDMRSGGAIGHWEEEI